MSRANKKRALSQASSSSAMGNGTDPEQIAAPSHTERRNVLPSEVFSQGWTGHPRKRAKATIGGKTKVHSLSMDREAIELYEEETEAVRMSLERNLLRYVMGKALAREPVHVHKNFWVNAGHPDTFNGANKRGKTVKKVLLYKTRKSLRDTFGLDLVPKGEYIEGKQGEPKWVSDGKECFVVNILAKPPRKKIVDETSSSMVKARRTDNFFNSLHGANDDRCAEQALVLVVLSIVWSSQLQRITRADLLTQLNTYFPNNDLKIVPSKKSNERYSRDPQFGNVYNFVVKGMVTNNYLKEISIGNDPGYEIGQRAHVEIGLQSIVHFAAVASGTRNLKWKTWMEQGDESSEEEEVSVDESESSSSGEEESEDSDEESEESS